MDLNCYCLGKIFNHTEGKLVELPGLPAMYDYEFFPQDLKV